MFKRGFTLTLMVIISVLAIGCSENSSVTAPGGESDALNAARMAKKADTSGNTIVDIALDFANADEPEFTILVAALQAADPMILAELGSKGQRTVFAPTDAAFDALFANPDFPLTPEELLADTELLSTVLLYHVAPGKRLSGDVLESEQIRMKAAGLTFPFLDGDSAYLGDTSDLTTDARLLAQEGLIDVIASNGVIHVIDQVLLP